MLMTTIQKVDAAISTSIRETRIVTITGGESVCDELRCLCDDSADAYGVTEFWGTDEDGSDWRVHVAPPHSA